jgi:hypothetical protein
VDVQTAAMISMQRALGDDLGEMEEALPRAVEALLLAIPAERRAAASGPGALLRGALGRCRWGSAG